MVYTIKIANKKFNYPKLGEELVASGFTTYGILWAGFNKLNDSVYQPNLSSKVIATSTGQPDDIAEIGEFRFRSDNVLSAPEDTALDNVLLNHDYTIKTLEQIRKDADDTQIQLLKNDYSNWDSLTDVEKDQNHKRLLRAVVRLILNNQAQI